MTIDISNLNSAELAELRSTIDKTIDKRRREDLINVRSEVMKLVTSRGFTMQEVVGEIGSSDQHFTRGMAYANPTDLTQVWVCGGSRPKWVRDLVDAGIPLTHVSRPEDSACPHTA